MTGSRKGSSKRHLTGSFGFLAATVALGVANLGNTAAADDSYYYAGGKRHTLPVSTQWLAVQLENGAQTADAAAAVRARSALDPARAVRKLARFNLAVLPLQNANSAAAQKTVRGSVAKSASVKRVFRAFGNGTSPIIETDQFVVGFKTGIDKARAAELLAQHGAVMVEKLGPYAPNGYLAKVVNPGVTATAVANALYESGVTTFAHPNFLSQKQKRYIPNDTYFDREWHLKNTEVPGADIGVEQAWNINRGSSSVTIAILDEGFDLTHEDLAANFVPGYDFVDHDADPSAEPGEKHGTACAGLAAAVGNNAKGISGVAPLCKILPVRVVGWTTDQDEADAFRYAADHNADVISNSWGPLDNQGVSQPLPDITQKGIHYAATSGRGGKGCVIFWAAGNGSESSDLDGYASNPEVISVAASTKQGDHAWYSDYGSSVDLNAPGGVGDIATTDNTGETGFSLTDYNFGFAGTSASCPIAAGVAALLLTQDPGMTRQQVQTVLQNTADKNGSGYDASGHSDTMGYGRVNAYKALLSIGNFAISGRITTSAGAGVPGVVVSSNNGATATTDSAGNYTLKNAGRGSVTITLSRTYYIFTPASKTLNLTGDTSNVNFSALYYLVTLNNPVHKSTVSRTVDFVGRTTNDSGTSRVDFEYRSAPYSNVVTANAPIPDNDTTGVSSSYVTNRVGRMQTATVTVDITHPFATDLIVSVLSPDGQEYVLHNRDPGTTNDTADIKKTFTLPIGTALPYLGAKWTLKVKDVDASASGTLNSWSMRVEPAWGMAARDIDGPTNSNWTGSWNTLPFSVGPYQVRGRGYIGGKSYDGPVYNITIAPGLQIGGKITLAGVGVPNISVARSGSTERVKTDSNGRYTFTGLARGAYTIVPTPSGGYTPASKRIAVDFTDVTNADFAVTSGSTTRDATTSASPVQLSSASATARGTVTLLFTGPLAPSAADPSHYTVAAGVESAAVDNATVTLTVPAGSLASGQKISVGWSGLRDAQNRAITDGSATVIVK